MEIMPFRLLIESKQIIYRAKRVFRSIRSSRRLSGSVWHKTLLRLSSFPVIDQIYYIHEGNPRLVTVFQSPTKETDRSITLYPGEGFLPTSAAGQKELSVTITMQMKSGLVIVLEIVPAPDIRQNAHRCVLNYNLAEVVAARRAAGLKVNLGDTEMSEQNKQTPRRFTFDDWQPAD